MCHRVLIAYCPPPRDMCFHTLSHTRMELIVTPQQEQKHLEDPSREVKKVRKARNRRQEWNMMAYDKEFRPDARLTPSPYHGMSSEGSLSPDRWATPHPDLPQPWRKYMASHWL